VRVCLLTGGYSVDYTPFPREALKFASEIRYDVVITDLVMKGMSGIDLYREIKPHSKQTRFMFMLRMSVEALRLMGSVERDDVIKKEPLSVNEVMGKVKAALA